MVSSRDKGFWDTLDVRHGVDARGAIGKGINYSLDEYWNDPRQALSYFAGDSTGGGIGLKNIGKQGKGVDWGGFYKYRPDKSSGVLRSLGHTANLLGTTFDVAQPAIRMAMGQQWDDALVGSAGDIGGSIGGGAVGAAIGSMFGPVGTVAGGLIGTVAGGITGGNVANWGWGKITGDETWGGWRQAPNQVAQADGYWDGLVSPPDYDNINANYLARQYKNGDSLL